MLINQDIEAKTLLISQRGYTEKVLRRFQMESCKLVGHHLNLVRNFMSYLATMNVLKYASSTTRLDIAATVGILSQYMSRPSKDHWMGVKRDL
jgi:hypothetical protein